MGSQLWWAGGEVGDNHGGGEGGAGDSQAGESEGDAHLQESKPPNETGLEQRGHWWLRREEGYLWTA